MTKLVELWPQELGNQGPRRSVKVPSELAYEYSGFKRSEKWGFQIPHLQPRIRWFKLGLDDKGKKYLETDKNSDTPDHRRLDYPVSTETETVVREYLENLRSHLHGAVKSKLGEKVFEEAAITYRFTIPGFLWIDSLRLFAQWVKEAGFNFEQPNTDIELVSKIEAAAIHCVGSFCSKGVLGLNDTFTLCDLGGAKSDMITLTIIQLQPRIRLREAAPRSSGFFGSDHLNRSFEMLARRKLESLEGWGTWFVERATCKFEETKRDFGQHDLQRSFLFPLENSNSIESKEFDKFHNVSRSGQVDLKVSLAEMQSIFDPVVDQVLDLLESHLILTQFPVKAVIPVGGFGQNPYLQKRIQKWLPAKLQLLIPEDGWNAAIVGSLDSRIPDDRLIQDRRIAPLSVGITNILPFKPGIHDKKRR